MRYLPLGADKYPRFTKMKEFYRNSLVKKIMIKVSPILGGVASLTFDIIVILLKMIGSMLEIIVVTIFLFALVDK